MQYRERLETLDGVRFAAALLVFIAHFEGLQLYYKLPFNSYSQEQVLKFGAMGVTIFFVLSGFLITLSIINSLTVKQDHWIRKFYIRRILRIWPLYFFITVVTFLMLCRLPFFYIPGYDLDYTPYLHSIIPFYLLMLPQIPFICFPNVPYVNVLWSVGVEELFYIFWPHVLKHKIGITKLAFALLLTWLMLKPALLVLHKFNLLSQPHTALLLEVLERNRFYCFAVGGAAAYLYKYKQVRAVTFAGSFVLQLAALLLLFFWLSPFSSGPVRPLIMNESISIASAIIILGCARNLKMYHVLRLPLISYLGRISYGIYCYHTIAIVVLFKSVNDKILNVNSLLTAFTLTFLLTIGMASCSYYFFEQKFLRLKSRYY